MKKAYLIVLLLATVAFSHINCRKDFDVRLSSTTNNASTANQDERPPNIVLIVADDIGYEIPRYTGGQSYITPNINVLAQRDIQFTQCQASPLCYPSRMMLMTGKYLFRNYVNWGIMDTTEYTIANMLKDAGYATCITGKWQLDGGDAAIRTAGFDRYRIFLPYTPPTVEAENAENWYRYKNPRLYENGSFLPDTATKGKYSEDLFMQYMFSFIDSNVTKPFFLLYSMSLCHYPFCPTPDDPGYATWTPESKITDTAYFPSMVKYMDKKVGQLLSRLLKKGLGNNTVVFYLGDNGSPPQITSLFRGQLIKGGKGSTIQYGTHVPLLVAWQGKIAAASVNNNIINLTDVMATMANIAGTSVPTGIDGVSFYPSLFNPYDTLRQWSFCHSQAYATGMIKRWAQTTGYKLYDSINNSRFYNILKDTLELTPITNKTITPEEKLIRTNLQEVMNGLHQ